MVIEEQEIQGACKEESHDTETLQSETNKQLEHCKIELQEWKDRCLRITADFDNFKKREEKARQQITRFAQAELIIDLLPIIDNFERALMQKKQEGLPAELQSWVDGIILIDKELHKYLHTIGLQEIKEMVKFNPELHEAVMTAQSTEVPSGDIVEVLQKGYRFKDAVIRPAKVSIAQ